MNAIKIGLCQMMVLKSTKEENINKAQKMICEAADRGARIVALPEMFNCPYNNKHFREYAESFPEGKTIKMLSSTAKEKNIYLVGGSIPEIEDDKIYNTCFIFDNNVKLVGKHRKVHLFDINIKNGVKFMESEVLSSGNEITLVDSPWGKVGVVICYDIRFPEIIRLMALKGAKIIFIPAAFNMTTGPAHWETLFKSRALDNQLYIAGISPARNVNYSYVAYGNSLITSPWGDIIEKLDEKEGILIRDIDLDYIEEVRNSLPLLKHRRKDLYNLYLL